MRLVNFVSTHKYILTETPDGNTPLLSSRRRRENGFKTHPKQTMCDNKQWVYLIRDGNCDSDIHYRLKRVVLLT